IGSLDEDGFLTVHGRKDDVINRGGEKISPGEIDDVLMSHPAIAEAATFPIPHSRLGEDVVAAVVLRAGTTANPIELRSYVRERVAPLKVPRRILSRDQLPKGETGKILRRRLAESWKEIVTTDTNTASPPLLIENASTHSGLVIQLTELWERLLETAPIFLDDDFFERGGGSLVSEAVVIKVEGVTRRTCI